MKEKILFLHGGPAFDSSYLKPWFEALSSDYELIFYDQLSNLFDTDVEQFTVDDILVELKDYVTVNQPIHIIAHSWGCFILMMALKRQLIHKSQFKTVTFFSPMPLTAKLCNEKMASLRYKVPEEQLMMLEKNIAQNVENAEEEYMEYITPFYHHDQSFSLKILPNVNFKLAMSLMHQIQDYDLRSVVYELPKATSVIYGQSDFLDAEEEYIKFLGSDHIYVIKNAGHYSFAEQNQIVRSLLVKCLSQLKQAA